FMVPLIDSSQSIIINNLSGVGYNVNLYHYNNISHPVVSRALPLGATSAIITVPSTEFNGSMQVFIMIITPRIASHTWMNIAISPFTLEMYLHPGVVEITEVWTSPKMIELHNNGDVPIDVRNWMLNFVTFSFFAEDTIIPAGGFKVFNLGAINLFEEGTSIMLFSDNRSIADYLEWSPENIPPMPIRNFSIAKAPSYYGIFSLLAWSLDPTPTPGASNDVPLPALGSSVIINEMGSAFTLDSHELYIELYNPTSNTINISGYHLVVADRVITIKTGINISAGGYYVLWEREYPELYVDNWQGMYLYTSNWRRIDQVSANGESWPECLSFNRYAGNISYAGYNARTSGYPATWRAGYPTPGYMNNGVLDTVNPALFIPERLLYTNQDTVPVTITGMGLEGEYVYYKLRYGINVYPDIDYPLQYFILRYNSSNIPFSFSIINITYDCILFITIQAYDKGAHYPYDNIVSFIVRDKTPPVIISGNIPDVIAGGQRVATGFCAYDLLSGIANLTLYCDGIPVAYMQEDGTLWWDVPLWDRQVNLSLVAKDKSNNTAYWNRTVIIDSSVPDLSRGMSVFPANYTSSTNYTISFVGISDSAGIEYIWYKYGSAPANETDGVRIPYTGSTFYFTQSMGLQEGNQTLYIWLEDRVGNKNISRLGYVYILHDSTPPAPPLNLSADRNSSSSGIFNLTWVLPEDTSGIEEAYITIDSIPSVYEPGILLEGINGSLVDLSALPPGQHIIYIYLKDKAGNLNYLNYSSIVLTIDRTEPYIITCSINDNAVNVPLNSVIHISFSEPMLQNGTIWLIEESSGTYISINTQWENGTSLTITSVELLNTSTSYTLTISDFKDVAGNTMITFTRHFTTGAEADTTPPALVNTVPVNGSILPDPAAAYIDLNWSEPVQISSLHGKVTIAYNSTTAEPANIVFVPDTNSTVRIYLLPLPYNTTVNITIMTGIKDLAGNPTAIAYQLSFITPASSGQLTKVTVNIRRILPGGSNTTADGASVVISATTPPFDKIFNLTAGAGGIVEFFIAAGEYNLVINLSGYYEHSEVLNITDIADMVVDVILNPVPVQAGGVQGLVQDKDGKPLAGVTVTLLFENGTVASAVSTDAEGKFVFTNITPARYYLN
ncbi:MAG: Ig-like domain-containing protein, partial [Thermoplasmata archaeon]